MSEQTLMVAPPAAGADADGGDVDATGVLATVLALADALDAVDWLAVEFAGDASSAWVSVATGTWVGVADVAFDFVAGLHAAKDNARATTAAAFDTARTCMAAPCSCTVDTGGRFDARCGMCAWNRGKPSIRAGTPTCWRTLTARQLHLPHRHGEIRMFTSEQPRGS